MSFKDMMGDILGLPPVEDDGDDIVLDHDVICGECGEHAQMMGLIYKDGREEKVGTDCCTADERKYRD